jgi:hypothetical protein
MGSLQLERKSWKEKVAHWHIQDPKWDSKCSSYECPLAGTLPRAPDHRSNIAMVDNPAAGVGGGGRGGAQPGAQALQHAFEGVSSCLGLVLAIMRSGLQH